MTAPSLAPQTTTVALATVDDMRERIRRKSKLKGRQADDTSVADVRALIGAAPHRRDLLQSGGGGGDGLPFSRPEGRAPPGRPRGGRHSGPVRQGCHPQGLLHGRRKILTALQWPGEAGKMEPSIP